jgi:hypothetical protein
MKYKAGEGYRLLKKSEVIPKGAERLYTPDGPSAKWVQTRAVGRTVESVPQDGFLYRVPKPLQAAKAPKEAKPREIVLELLSDGKGHEFPEIHSVLTAKVGKRTEKATRVLLQDLKDSGLLAASAVEYSKVQKGVQG